MSFETDNQTSKIIRTLKDKLEAALDKNTKLEKDLFDAKLAAKTAEGREKIAIGIAQKHQAMVKKLREQK